MAYDKEALIYHNLPTPGKVSVTPTKPCLTQRDLSLAYTPGVAAPCLAIEKDPERAYSYTSKGNLVAVVSNGTAVLGLGDIGPLGGKPVMEGKGVLFKRFANIDVFDIELDTKDPKEVILACKLMAPTFGGINLEDIKAPECFEIEEVLKEALDIPVFHDDQHGTAIISGAALLNALEIIGKDIGKIKVVFNGAGAAGIACAKFYESLGVRHENVLMCDSKGVIYKGREDLEEDHPRYNKYKAYFAADTDKRTLDDAMEGADAFAGVSVADVVSQDMVRSMAKDPIIFAMANPDPEITYDAAVEARSDVIMATGRSDYPNQVNNVLGFPFIFRGALDVRARAINEEMKVAAARALADLAKEDVPDTVLRAYHTEKMSFGREYLIPKPFDPRVLTREAVAVAKAAVESGVARKDIEDWEAYRDQLEKILGAERETIRRLIHQAQVTPHRIVIGAGVDEKMLRAAHIIAEERIGTPVLLGDEQEVKTRAKELGLALDDVEVIQPSLHKRFDEYVDMYYDLRKRKGVNRDEAIRDMRSGVYFGPMMVRFGDADVYISGRGRYYPLLIRPMLRVMKDRMKGRVLAGVYMAIVDHKQYFLADTTVNMDPTEDELVQIAENMHELVTSLGMHPRLAFLSFSNFGSNRHPSSEKMQRAVEKLWKMHPDWDVDGEMQADVAVNSDLLNDQYPFAKIQGGANCLIFPSLNASNIAYRLLRSLGKATLVGPMLTGLDLPMHVLERGCDVEDIVNIAAIGAVQAQARKRR